VRAKAATSRRTPQRSKKFRQGLIALTKPDILLRVLWERGCGMGVEAEVSGPVAEERLLAHLVRGQSVEFFVGRASHPSSAEGGRRRVSAAAADDGRDARPTECQERWPDPLITLRRARGGRGSSLPVAALVPRHATSGRKPPQTARSRKEAGNRKYGQKIARNEPRPSGSGRQEFRDSTPHRPLPHGRGSSRTPFAQPHAVALWKEGP